MIKSKKSNIGFSQIVLIIIALIVCMLIITIIAYILGAFTDPNRINEGITCRIAIQATSRIEEGTQGIISGEKLLDACKTIKATIPRNDEYPEYGGIPKYMTPDELEEGAYQVYKHTTSKTTSLKRAVNSFVQTRSLPLAAFACSLNCGLNRLAMMKYQYVKNARLYGFEECRPSCLGEDEPGTDK